MRHFDFLNFLFGQMLIMTVAPVLPGSQIIIFIFFFFAVILQAFRMSLFLSLCVINAASRFQHRFTGMHVTELWNVAAGEK